MRKYTFVASLGENCACAGLLNKLFLRTESSPFDWIRASSFQQRIELISNEFSDFLSEYYLKRIGGGDTHDSQNDIYIQKKYGIEFLHDFPSNATLKTVLPLIKKKYERRSERFLTHLREDKTLLVFISKNKHDPFSLLKNIEFLNKKFHSNNIFLLYIEHNKDLPMTETLEESFGRHLYYVQINNSPTDFSDDFLILQGNIPIISDVICRYSRGISYKEFLSRLHSAKYKFLHASAQFISCFVLSNKHRKKMRHFLFSKINNLILQ